MENYSIVLASTSERLGYRIKQQYFSNDGFVCQLKKELPNSFDISALTISDRSIIQKTQLIIKSEILSRFLPTDTVQFQIQDQISSYFSLNTTQKYVELVFRFELENSEMSDFQHILSYLESYEDLFCAAQEIIVAAINNWQMYNGMMPIVPDYMEIWHILFQQIFKCYLVKHSDAESPLVLAKVKPPNEMQPLYITTIVFPEFLIISVDSNINQNDTEETNEENPDICGNLEVNYLFTSHSSQMWKNHYILHLEDLIKVLWNENSINSDQPCPSLDQLIPQASSVSYTSQLFTEELTLYTYLKNQQILDRFLVRKIDKKHEKVFYNNYSNEMYGVEKALHHMGHEGVADAIIGFAQELMQCGLMFKRIKLKRFIFGPNVVFHIPIEISSCLDVIKELPGQYIDNIYNSIYEKILRFIGLRQVAQAQQSLMTINPIELSVSTRHRHDGKYSQVYTKCRFLGEKVVARVDTTDENLKERHNVSEEFCTLGCLQHDYVLRYYGMTTLHNAQTWVVLEFCSQGTLESAILNGTLPDDTHSLICKITSGLTYWHTKNVAYLNLSTRNILLDEQFNPKFTGFGRDVDETIFVEPDAFDQKSDIWSFGCIVYSIITGTVLQNISDIDLDRIEQPRYMEILQSCFAAREQRPYIQQILKLL